MRFKKRNHSLLLSENCTHFAVSLCTTSKTFILSSSGVLKHNQTSRFPYFSHFSYYFAYKVRSGVPFNSMILSVGIENLTRHSAVNFSTRRTIVREKSIYLMINIIKNTTITSNFPSDSSHVNNENDYDRALSNGVYRYQIHKRILSWINKSQA